MIWIIGLVVFCVLVVRWRKSLRAGYAAHEAMWKPARTVGPSGLSMFQQLAESEVLARLALDGFRFAERNHLNAGQADSDSYIEATIAGTPLTLWIYTDGAGIGGPGIDRRFEDWDAASPEELVEEIASTAAELARNHRDAM